MLGTNLNHYIMDRFSTLMSLVVGMAVLFILCFFAS